VFQEGLCSMEYVGFVPIRFPNKNLYAFLIALMCANMSIYSSMLSC